MRFEDPANSFLASQMLEDGHIVNWTGIDISHSDKQEDYLNWKRQRAVDLDLNCSQISRRRLNSTYGPQILCSFYIRDLKSRLSSMRDLSPGDLVRLLDPLGLLCWWLDDGCLSVSEKASGSVARHGTLSTHAFSLDENQDMSLELYRSFGIQTTVHRDRQHFRLYINATNMRIMIDVFRDLIRHVPVCMLYKFNMDYRPNRLGKSLEYSKLYNF